MYTSSRKRQCVFFACSEFMGDNSFTFHNWKNSHRLKKHAKSDGHRNAMTKWISSKINAKHQTSVLNQLKEAHQQDVLRNREYLCIIIECLIFTAQQNIAIRGHEETCGSRRNCKVNLTFTLNGHRHPSKMSYLILYLALLWSESVMMCC